MRAVFVFLSKMKNLSIKVAGRGGWRYEPQPLRLTLYMSRSMSLKHMYIFMWKFLLKLKSQLHSMDTQDARGKMGAHCRLNFMPQGNICIVRKTQDWLWMYAQHPASLDLGFLSPTRYLEFSSNCQCLCPWRPGADLMRPWGSWIRPRFSLLAQG